MNPYPTSDEEEDEPETVPQSTQRVREQQKNRWAYVSSKGRFKNSRGVIYTPKPHANGYSSVFFKRKMMFHRLVCRVFNGPSPRPDCNEVNHKDHNPSNNTPENLEWCTRTENNVHRIKTSNTLKRSIPVIGKRVEDPDDAYVSYTSAAEAARCLNLHHSHVSHSAKYGKPTQGFQFKLGIPSEPRVVPGEEWKSACNGKLRISSFGRVCNVRFETIYTPTPRSNGYCVVTLCGKLQQVHRLVCEAFHGPPPNKEYVVDHIDMDPSNNRADNLRWVTHSENIKSSWEKNESRGTCVSKNHIPVEAQKIGQSGWVQFESACDAARSLSLDNGAISHRCKSGGTHGGYRFRYVTQKTDVLHGETWLPVLLDF